jgi:hypothetical protein
VEAQFFLNLFPARGRISSVPTPDPFGKAYAATIEKASRIDEETGEILKANPLPPDEVMHIFITARQKSQWNNFCCISMWKGLCSRNPEIETGIQKPFPG